MGLSFSKVFGKLFGKKDICVRILMGSNCWELGVRAGFLPPGTPFHPRRKNVAQKARVTLLTKCATLHDFAETVRGLHPPLSKRRSVAVQNKGEPRNERARCGDHRSHLTQ